MQIIYGIKKAIIERLIWSHLFYLAVKTYKSPLKAIKTLLKLENTRRAYMGEHAIQRIVKTGKQYSYHPNIPSWPSYAFNSFHEIEMNRILPFRPPQKDLTLLILSITKKCPLNCEHCFEWDIMHQKEVLTLPDMIRIVQEQQEKGLAILELSGGEPLNRFKELVPLISFASAKSEIWLLSSAYGLSLAKAEHLKKAGLTGITISLDHFDEQQHNHFRGHAKSFEWVLQGIDHAQQVGLTLCLSICVTRSFCTKENLLQYLEKAKSLGVPYVQFLEPKAKGNYADKDVTLSEEQSSLLTDFQQQINTQKKYRNHPMVVFHGFHQRRMGCLGGGNRYQYIDSNGDIFPCPFCVSPMGNALGKEREGKDNAFPVCEPFEFAVQ